MTDLAMTDAHLFKMAGVLAMLLQHEGFTAQEGLAIFEIALRTGRVSAPPGEAERCTKMADRALLTAGIMDAPS